MHGASFFKNIDDLLGSRLDSGRVLVDQIVRCTARMESPTVSRLEADPAQEKRPACVSRYRSGTRPGGVRICGHLCTSTLALAFGPEVIEVEIHPRAPTRGSLHHLR